MIGHRSLKEGGGGGERSSQGGCAEIPSVIDVPPSTLNLLVSIYWGFYGTSSLRKFLHFGGLPIVDPYNIQLDDDDNGKVYVANLVG